MYHACGKGKLFIQKRAKNKPLFKTYSKMKSVHIKVHVVRTTLPFEEWISDTLHKQLSSLVFTTLQFRKAKMPTFNLCHVAIAFEFLTSGNEYCSWSKVKSPSILLNASLIVFYYYFKEAGKLTDTNRTKRPFRAVYFSCVHFLKSSLPLCDSIRIAGFQCHAIQNRSK